MKTLIIGGTGFIGLATAEALRDQGHEVTICHRKTDETLTFNQMKCDREDVGAVRECVKTTKPDRIIHMCAMTGRHVAVLKEALKESLYHETRVLIVSSADVYKAFEAVNRLTDAPIQPTPFSERSALRDLRNFRANYEKIDAETEAKGLNAVVARLGMVYGKNDPYRRFQAIADDLRKGDKITIGRNAANWRSCYVGARNAANMLACLVEKGQAGEAYNVADRRVLTEIEWRRKIAETIGFRGEIIVSGDAGEDVDGALNYEQDLILDVSKIGALCDEKRLFSHEDELLETLTGGS